MSNPPRIKTALAMFQRECERVGRGTAMCVDHSPAQRVLCEMLEDPEAARLTFSDHLASFVHQRLLEQTFGGECGDAVIDPHYRPPLDDEVEVVVGVYRRVRRCAEGSEAAPAAAEHLSPAR